MYEGHISEIELDIEPEIRTTQEWSQMAKNSSNLQKPTCSKTRSNQSTLLTMLLTLINSMLMPLMFLTCLIMILMHHMFL
jgi:hypothetical protein